MKQSSFLLLVTSAMLVVTACSHPVENAVRCVQLDPLEKVFTEESYFVENNDTAVVAKGETATFQFVLKSVFPISDLKMEAGHLVKGDLQIAPTLKAFVGYIRAGNHTTEHSIDAVFPVSDYYPDCLQEMESIDVAAMQNQPVWVSYAVPRDAADGDYSATLIFTGKINGQAIKITKQVHAKVYPVVLPEQALWVSNWITTSSSCLAKLNRDEPVEPYSDRYWELLAAIAHTAHDHGQNAYKIRDLLQLCNIRCNGAQYTFDFANFDKTIELLIREGGLKRIEGGHFCGRTGNWTSEFGVDVPDVGRLPVEDLRTQNFLAQFLPALHKHLEAKGWTKMYVQYIADEPLDENADSYIKIAGLVKKHMPGVPLIDAVMSQKLANTVNIWVPKLDHYRNDRKFFDERQAAGDEVWFYTCYKPQGNYANRFLEQPLIQTRFLHWINYRYGLTGYLHWGFNNWHLYTTDDASYSILPAGDASITYPAEGKVYGSIRLAAMRDGIADYELLRLLEQKAPDKAKEVVGEVIGDVDSYNSNIRAFRLTRLKLLNLLSEDIIQ